MKLEQNVAIGAALELPDEANAGSAAARGFIFNKLKIWKDR
jgi:hypothetical protein